MRLAKRPGAKQPLVHTDQHCDVKMSDVFFQQLAILAPDVNLAVGPDYAQARLLRS
jgi:UDP-N-acetylglucosamine 2-epimerase